MYRLCQLGAIALVVALAVLVADRAAGRGFEHGEAAIGQDGTIYVGAGPALYALSSGGSELWVLRGDWSRLYQPVLGDDGTIYATCARSSPAAATIDEDFDGSLIAVTPQGKLKWTFDAPTALGAPPALGPYGTLYFTGNDRQLYAVGVDGELRWMLPGNAVPTTGPAVASDGTIYYADYDLGLRALKPDRTVKWSYQAAQGDTISLALAPAGAVVISSLREVARLNPDGSVRWRVLSDRLPGQPGFTAPLVRADGRVYVGDTLGTLWAFNAQGKLLWTYTVGGWVWKAPALSPQGGVVFADNRSGLLVSLAADGRKLWEYRFTGEIYHSPTVLADGTVLAGDENGLFVALDSQGKELWRHSAGAAVSGSPAIGPDGTLYVGSSDGCLYAFQD